MSADNMENLVQEVGLDRNAHVIIKPPAIGELKNLWQYAMSSNSKNKRTGDQGQTSTKRKSTPRDGNEDDEDNDNGENNNPSKKNNKLVWSTKLHNKFLEAIRVIGFKRAVPKKILEYMNVPGLTRENVASHLQKYRIYLKRICDARVSARTGIPENWNQRPFRSNFTWSQFPDLASKSYLLNYATAVRANQNQQPRRASPPSNFGATQLGVNDHTTMRPSFADTKPQCFGAFPSQGLTNSSLNTSYAEKPLPRSSLHQPINKNDVLARVAAKCFTNTSLPLGRLNILESSMVPASNVDYQDSSSGDSTIDQADGQVSDQSQEMAATPGELSGYSGSDMGRASSNETIVAHPHQGVGINLNDNTGASAGDQIYDENQFVQHYQPTVISMPGFVEQQPPAAVNLSFNFAEHPAPTVYTTAQPSTFLMSGMSNFAQQPPYHYAGVVNLPNYFVPQQAQPVGAAANMMSEFVAQQPHLASAVTNMSGLRHNISTTGYPQVLIPNREMENLSIKCEVEEISDNVNSITAPPMTAGNRLGISASAGSNNVHQQGSQAFYQFSNWAPSTTYDDHSMDHQGEFANGLLSNNDPQIDNKNAN